MEFLRSVLIVVNYIWLGLAMMLFVGSTLAFRADCSITNQTSQTIFVTPVGAVDNSSSRFLLPLHHTFFPNLLQIKLGDFEIVPGKTFHFAYDTDDIGYTELAIESGGKMVGQFIVGSQSSNNLFSAPTQPDIVIDDLSTLQPISPSVASAAAEAKKSSGIWMLYAFIILPWISTSFLGIYEWRKKRAARNQ